MSGNPVSSETPIGCLNCLHILGWVAQRFPELISRIADAGHEIACHGTNHDLIYSLSPDAFRDDVKQCKELLEQQTGREVVGYRAPSFSITAWAIVIHQELGVNYAS